MFYVNRIEGKIGSLISVYKAAGAFNKKHCNRTRYRKLCLIV